MSTIVVWELWDTEAGNLVAEFDSRDEALTAIRTGIAADGVAHYRTLALGHCDEDGTRNHEVASGDELVRLADETERAG